MGLAPEKVLLKWMNFHLKKAGYKKSVANFSSDLKVSSTAIYQVNLALFKFQKVASLACYILFGMKARFRNLLIFILPQHQIVARYGCGTGAIF